MEGEEKNEFVLYEDESNDKEEERRENSMSEVEMISDEEYMLECARFGEKEDLLRLFEELKDQININYQDFKKNTALRINLF